MIALHAIHKQYGDTSVLKGISLEIAQGESVAITGKSGEGKSTLLHIMGALEKPTSGRVEIFGQKVEEIPLHLLRNQKIGFIFQSYHLLEEQTVLDNILLPQKIGRNPCHKGSAGYEKALALLEEVGLREKAHLLVKLLSGGEKQRAAIARAFVNDPLLILADEPTGNLDSDHSQKVQALLLELAKKKGKSVVIATHDLEFAASCGRRLILKEGTLRCI
jgi:lipoprotein-releasing system ATP-binding protein